MQLNWMKRSVRGLSAAAWAMRVAASMCTSSKVKFQVSFSKPVRLMTTFERLMASLMWESSRMLKSFHWYICTQAHSTDVMCYCHYAAAQITCCVMRLLSVMQQKAGPIAALFAKDGALSYLPKVSHLPQVLDIQVVASVWHDHLRALPCQRIYNVAAQEPSTPEDCRCDPADLHNSTTRILKASCHIQHTQ